MTDCGASGPSSLIAEQMASYLECHAQTLAQTGFANLTGGWIGPAFLGGCLTIYVALIGYRLVLGLPYGPRDAVLAAARAGVVMAMATSWPTYEATIYRLMFEGPTEVAGLLLPADLGALSITDAAQRLDQDLLTLRKLASGGAATNEPAPGAAPAGPQPPQSPQSPPAQTQIPDQDPILDSAGTLLAGITVGTLGAVRLTGGLLVGVGPLFIILALFDVALGLFEGWVRAFWVAFVAALGAMIVTALELGFLENGLILGNPTALDTRLQLDPTLMAIGALFALAMLAVIAAAFMVGGAFRLPIPRKAVMEAPPAPVLAPRATTAGLFALAPPSRADTVVEAVRRLSEREAIQTSVARAAAPIMGSSRERRLQGRTAGIQAGREPYRALPARRWSPGRAANLERGDPPK